MDSEQEWEQGIRLEALYEEWNETAARGAIGSWTDGKALNYIRRRIEYQIGQMKELGCQHETYNRELPPLMDESYMVGSKGIRKEAEAALRAYQEDENYRYIKESVECLGGVFPDSVKRRLDKEILFVKKLEVAIFADDLPAMKKYLDTEKNLKQLRMSRVAVEIEVEALVPF